MECPEENVVVDFVRGELGRDARARLESHIDACEACAQVVAQMAMIFDDGPALDESPPPLCESDGSHDRVEVTMSSTTEGAFSPVRTGGRRPSAEATPLLPQGFKLGRYVVIDRIGSGGMGVVYAAYDPELDRKIALKVLRHASRGTPAEQQQQRTRLLREAQAMAKLSHPNVITVHDVGTVEGQVFLAMEFIDGQTLKSWMKTRHPWREVLPIFRRAAQGLASAHAAGLVHRDFKPDNVLLGRDGRVLVTDFGLARPAAGKTGSFTSVATLESGSEQVLTATLTQTGALVGTPAYMPPEQLAGERTDALSDQFSFCVALYEALYGERPFPGRSLAELMTNVSAGEMRAVPRDASVPRWIRRVLLRGLAVEPDQRFESMTTLLGALRADPWAKWRRVSTVAVPAGLLAVGLFAYRQSMNAESAYCDEVDHKLAGVWDDARRAEIERAFASTQRSYWRDAFDHVATAFDGYSDRWVQLQTAACHDQIAGEQPQAILALRMTCLSRRHANLSTLSDLFARADVATVEGAVDAVRSLPSLEACEDLDALTQHAPAEPLGLDPEVLERMAREVAEAKLLRAAGKYAEVLAVAQQLVDDARAAGHRPLEAEGLMLVAESHDLLGHVREAEPAYHEALSAALAAGHTEVMAHVSVGLVWLTGASERRLEEAERWATHGLAACEQMGNDPEIVSRIHHALGVAQLGHDRFEDAERSLREAIDVRTKAFGPDHPSLGGPIGSLGRLHAARGQRRAAVEEFERALELVQREYGPDHPNTASAIDNLGSAYAEAGQYETALGHQRRALKIRVASLGASHPMIASSHQNLAASLRSLGRLDEALQHAQQAVALFADVPGKDSSEYVRALSSLGQVEVALDRYDDAEAHARQALDLAVPYFGERNGVVAEMRERYAFILDHLDRKTEAVSELRTVLRLREALRGPDHPSVAFTAGRLAVLVVETGGSAKEAKALAERAVSIASKADALRLAIAQFALARVLWADTEVQDRQRAEILLQSTETFLQGADDHDAVLDVGSLREAVAEFRADTGPA